MQYFFAFVGNKSHSKTSLWLIQSKAHLGSPHRKVSVVVFGPPRGCFHSENWASCPCHPLAIGERALAMVIRHTLHLQSIPISKTFPDPSLFSCPLLFRLLNFDNTIQALDESAARERRAWGGGSSASFSWCLLSSHQRNEASSVFSKVKKNSQVIA